MITGKDLQNRGPQAEGEQGRKQTQSAAERLALLEERIEQARTLKPSGKDLHCEDCFHRGRNAVLKLLGGEP